MQVRGVVLDVDGTVLRGDQAVDGALEGLEAFAAAEVARLFVTNNPTASPDRYVDRFARAGIDVDVEEVLTAGMVTARYLAETHPGAATLVLGEAGVVEQVETAGLEVVVEPAEAEVVVASIDREFDYDDLCCALWALEDDDVAFVGTDPDMVIPAADRDRPGSGAIINAVAGVAGRQPDAVLGKPSPTAREMVTERLGLPPADCAVVGDRLDTDVALGGRAGMTTVLVRSGVASGAALETADADVTPDHVVDSLADAARVLLE
jgi:4-nitrophenyl phosphatase